MKLFVPLVLLAVPAASAASAFRPKHAAFGSGPVFQSPKNAAAASFPLRLTRATPCVTLDYGFDVAGQPRLSVRSVSGSESSVDVEVKYAEWFTSLTKEQPSPYAWGASLANSNRVETFRFSGATSAVAMTQGAQRYQTLCLLRGDAVVFDAIDFKATVPVVENIACDLPGSFESSDPTLNAIWTLGPRATSVACIGARSQPQLWTSDAVNGTHVPGIRPGYSYKLWNVGNYVLEFETLILRGGLRVSIGYDVGVNSDALNMQLACEYPVSSTFSNANKELFPPNTISLAYDADASYALKYTVPFAVQENAWYKVKIAVDAAAHRVAFSLNGTLVFNMTASELPNFSAITDPTFTGAIGFGGWQDHAAYVRNMVVTDRVSGKQLYTNPMTDAATVASEFGQQTNAYGLCMDGGRRDRYLWLGDVYHAVRVVGVGQGIHDREAVKGTFKYVFDFQMAKGQFQPYLPISYVTPMPTPEIFAAYAAIPEMAFFVFPDYHLLGLVAYVSFMEYGNDVAFTKVHWSQLVRAVNWIDTYRTPNGLLDFSRDYVAFIGPTNGVALNCLAVQAYRGMARVATAVGDSGNATTWNTRADGVTAAVQTNFWNSQLGVFADIVSKPDQYSVAGVAFAVTSGVATKEQALSSLAVVDKTLRPKSQVGYLDSTTADATGKISPNTNGFLLDALLQMKRGAEAMYLIKSLWGPMLQDKLTSGGAWEYVAQDGTPGLGDGTSMSHPWSGAASYTLTNFVAGIQPVTFGFKTWRIEPQLDVFDLTNVKSRVLTAFGTLAVEWRLTDAKTKLSVAVTVPKGTSGEFSVFQKTTNTTFTNKISKAGKTTFTVKL